MNTFALINIGKKQLGLHDDDYRALLQRTVGKDSLRTMTEKERERIVAALEKLGFQRSTKGSSDKLYFNKKYVRLIHALWKSAHEKGAIRDGSKTALRTFVKKETGVSDPEFLTYVQATPVIEALKAMEARAR